MRIEAPVEAEQHPRAGCAQRGGGRAHAGEIHVDRLFAEHGFARGDRTDAVIAVRVGRARSEEHTSELQSLMRISYAVFCLKKQKANSTTLEHSKQLYKTTTTLSS